MIKPMLAESAQEPFDSPDYIYEIKLDGVRCIAYLDSDTRLQARSGADITHKFPELAHLHQQVSQPAILDGEIVGVTFRAIQHRIQRQNSLAIKIAQGQYPAFSHFFDVLSAGHESVMAKPQIERKAILQSIFTDSYHGRLLRWTTQGVALAQLTKENQLEGIMAKAMYAPYIEGKRSRSWLKIKNFREGVFHICGLTQGERSFGSLVLGEVVDGQMCYVGNCGTGFDQGEIDHILHLLEPGDCPFQVQPDLGRELQTWARPSLRCEVRYLERTDTKLRFPSFRRLVKT